MNIEQVNTKETFLTKLKMFVVFFVFYVLFVSKWDVGNLLIGVVFCAMLASVLPALNLSPFSIKHLPQFLGGFGHYIFTLVMDITRGAIVTSWIVLHPKMPLNTGIVAIQAGSSNELVTALSAHAITLSPGEMVIMIEDVGEEVDGKVVITDGVMYTHCLDIEKSEEMVNRAQEMRNKALTRMFS
jgi:multicomponent Na+:H+ antiporter subunit E